MVVWLKHTGGVLCICVGVCVYVCVCGYQNRGVLSEFHRTGTSKKLSKETSSNPPLKPQKYDKQNL